MKRKEAINHLSEWMDEKMWRCFGTIDREAIGMAIEALSREKNEWIPITTSEPTTSNHVLVTYKWDEDDYETSELDYWVTKCAAEEGNKQCQMFIDHVIAWSFMPKPYKEI